MHDWIFDVNLFVIQPTSTSAENSQIYCGPALVSCDMIRCKIERSFEHLSVYVRVTYETNRELAMTHIFAGISSRKKERKKETKQNKRKESVCVDNGFRQVNACIV